MVDVDTALADFRQATSLALTGVIEKLPDDISRQQGWSLILTALTQVLCAAAKKAAAGDPIVLERIQQQIIMQLTGAYHGKRQ